MKRALLTAITLSLSIALLAGCNGAVSQVAAAGRPRAASKGGALDPALVTAINDFGFDLFREVSAAGENTVISPLSIHAALSMTAVGARSSTAEEMHSVLHLDSVDPDGGGWSWQYLLAELMDSDDITLEIANSLWAQKDLPFEQEFIDADRDFFGAEIRTLDLQAPDAADEINGWVADNTHDRITEIIDAPDPDAILEIVNAVYFLGDWEKPFEEQDTHEQTFFPATGDPFGVPMMHSSGDWEYGESETLQMVRMTYEGQRFAAYVIVPREGSAPESLLEDMTAEEWATMRAALVTSEGSVALPRFELEWGAGKDLAGPLAAMGMPGAFSRVTADFSGISAELDADPGLEISRVLHKTYLAVDETGTEAAAATDVEITLGAMVAPAEDYFELRADRPFIFAIGDESSGSLLFLGVIEDPREQ